MRPSLKKEPPHFSVECNLGTLGKTIIALPPRCKRHNYILATSLYDFNIFNKHRNRVIIHSLLIFHPPCFGVLTKYRRGEPFPANQF